LHEEVEGEERVAGGMLRIATAPRLVGDGGLLVSKFRGRHRRLQGVEPNIHFVEVRV
jgi:hypothetical protein